MDREGYYVFTQNLKSCGLCKWHEHIMIHSGRHPLYHHYCTHTNVITFKTREIEKRFIGEEPITPSWCPVGQMEGKF